MSDTMQAAVLDAPSTPFQVKSIARPFPGAGQVLVRIAASGVNPLDTKIYAGQAAHARHPLPGILGMNLAGQVEAVGSGVKGFARGDEVYGMTGGVGGLQGSLAQYAAVDADHPGRQFHRGRRVSDVLFLIEHLENALSAADARAVRHFRRGHRQPVFQSFGLIHLRF